MASYQAEVETLCECSCGCPHGIETKYMADINPGNASSYIFNCKPGKVTVSGLMVNSY